MREEGAAQLAGRKPGYCGTYGSCERHVGICARKPVFFSSHLSLSGVDLAPDERRDRIRLSLTTNDLSTYFLHRNRLLKFDLKISRFFFSRAVVCDYLVVDALEVEAKLFPLAFSRLEAQFTEFYFIPQYLTLVSSNDNVSTFLDVPIDRIMGAWL